MRKAAKVLNARPINSQASWSSLGIEKKRRPLLGADDGAAIRDEEN